MKMSARVNPVIIFLQVSFNPSTMQQYGTISITPGNMIIHTHQTRTAQIVQHVHMVLPRSRGHLLYLVLIRDHLKRAVLEHDLH